MKKQTLFAALVCLFLLQSIPSVSAQDVEPAPAPADEAETPATEEPAARAGQEVEINEDTYRQFMELKDANRQGDMIPEDAFKPGTGLQKLEKLPEESQKHLRNELREIIVQGDPWQPGDEDAEYPYVPSAAAGKDPSLQKQEQEAWGELVDSYNQREAQIYANSDKSSAAMGSQEGGGNKPGDGESSDGDDGQNEEGKAGQQAGQESDADASDTAGTYSANAPNDPNARSTAGVSQNAMEFLQGLGKGGTDAGSGNLGAPVGNGGQSESPASSEGEGQTQGQGESQAQAQESGQAGAESADQGEAQADGDDAAQTGSQGDGQSQDAQQTETAPKTAPSIPPAENSPALPVEPEEESTAGASQNAFEYLTGDSARSGDGSGNEKDSAPPEGTLNIQDLLNAQGVGTTTGVPPASNEADDNQNPGDNLPEKDGGGL